MNLGKVILARLKPHWGSSISNHLIYFYSSNISTFQCFPHFYKSNLCASCLVREVIFRLPYSTNSRAGSKKETSLLNTPEQPKKKKEIKVYITLLGNDGNIISITTVDEASRLALRRNMRLVRAMDLDPKTGRAVYKLVSESDYLKGDTEWEDSTVKKEKEKTIKGNKVVSLTSSTAEHDVLIKVKMMLRWLEKKFEVRIVITGDVNKGENVFKIIEKEIGTNGRIVQKRTKGQDIRFQILPPKLSDQLKKTEKKSEEKDV